jgi:hypothetical protein
MKKIMLEILLFGKLGMKLTETTSGKKNLRKEMKK